MRPRRFVERLIVSASFSAFRRLLRVVSPGMLQGLAPLSILGVMWTGELQALQTLCGMLAGHGLSLAAPMPSEPAGYLVAPVVLLYFGVIGGVGWCVEGTLQLVRRRAGALSDAVDTVFEQYISLFATTRAIGVFQGAGQQSTLCFLSVVYLCLPSASGGGGQQQQQRRHHHLPKYFVRCVENLAVRGGMLSAGQMLAQWADPEGLLVLYLLCIMATAPIAWRLPVNDGGGGGGWGAKLQGCHAVLSLLCAQHVVRLLSGGDLSALTGGCLLSTLSLLLSTRRRGSGEHVFSDVCAFSLSLMVTLWMEQWLEGSPPIETACVYACVFGLLQCLRHETDIIGISSSSSAGAFVLATQAEATELW